MLCTTSKPPSTEQLRTRVKEKPASEEDKLHDEELLPFYKIIRFLNAGAYGLVYLVQNMSTSEELVVKKTPSTFVSLMSSKKMLREVFILRMLQHEPHIIRLRKVLSPLTGPIENLMDVSLVFDRGDMDMSQLIASDQYLKNVHVQYFMRQLLLGLQSCHSKSIVHRDLKPANIIVNKDCYLRICDFGLARVLDLLPELEPKEDSKDAELFTPLVYKSRHVATRWYRAPEVVILTDTYDTQMDMWSCGTVFAELLTMIKATGYSPRKRFPLFPGKSCFPLSQEDGCYINATDQLNVIFDLIGTPSAEDLLCLPNLRAREYIARLPHKPRVNLASKFPFVDPQAITLLDKMLQFNPAKRITAEEALKHPYVQIDMTSYLQNRVVSEPFHVRDQAALQAYYKLELEMDKQLRIDVNQRLLNATTMTESEFQEQQRKITDNERIKMLELHRVGNIKKIKGLILQQMERDKPTFDDILRQEDVPDLEQHTSPAPKAEDKNQQENPVISSMILA